MKGDAMRKLILFITLLDPQIAAAQTIPCAPRDQVLEFLIESMAETRQAVGTAGRGTLMEVYAGDSGSWSIVLHLPDGRSCLLANGTGFEAMHGLLPALGRPA